MHCFLKVPPFSESKQYNILFQFTFRHPQKSKCASKSFKFRVRIKSVYIVFLVFYSPPKFETLTRRPQLRTRVKPSSKQNLPKYLKKAEVFALFFEGAIHLRMHWTLTTEYCTLPRTLKNQNVPARVSNFGSGWKALLLFFGFFIQTQNWKPLQDFPNSEREKKTATKEILLLRNYPD